MKKGLLKLKKKINLPLSKENISLLKAGDEVFLTGDLITARDAAHKRLIGEFKNKKKFPINLKNETIYYTGPTPALPGKVIGSCGPTTSSRMDEFTEILLKGGLAAMIGKGRRAPYVKNAIKKNKAVYLIAPAGAGAYLSKKILKKKLILYKDLGPEAIYRLRVKDFPVIVAIDSKGKDIYESR